MPKRKCVFNEKLQSEYSFLKKCTKPGQEYKIECIVCGATFSIDHWGKSDITEHLKSERHNIAARLSKSQKVSDFFSSKKVFADSKQKLGANEGVLLIILSMIVYFDCVYKSCKHNQSLKSMDFISQLVR